MHTLPIINITTDNPIPYPFIKDANGVTLQNEHGVPVRNYISYNIEGEIMAYSPNVRLCEMFLNDEYMGIYLLIEKIKYNHTVE